MMQVRWTTQAATALEQIGDYIAAENPQAAHSVVNTIYERVQQLADFPSLGRIGRVVGTRELVIHSKTTPSTCNGLKTMTKYGIYEGQLHQS